jgi:hypothetical protein
MNLAENLILDRCPHCKVGHPNLRSVHHIETNNHQQSHLRRWRIYQCATCGGLTIASGQNWNSIVNEVFPALDKIDDNIPSPAREYLEQANDTIHAASGSIMLSASSIDAMLKIKGYKDGTLYERINKASKEHLITDGMAKWAHKVRLDANEQRHADDKITLPTVADAKHTLDFAKALGQFLFVLPSKVEKGIADTEPASPQQ